MKTKIHFASRTLRFAFWLALLATLNSQPSALYAQSTAFTYQGRVTVGANPANGNYDMQFYLLDTLAPPGNPVGPTNAITPVAVSNGLFTVALDFGANFPGADRWLEIGVRTNGAASYTTLSPRQKLTPTPYAMTANNLSGTVAASQLSGALPATQLSGTVADARLSANAALLNRNPQTFTGQNIFNSSVGIGTASPAAPLHVKQGSGSGLIPGSAAILGDAQANTYGIWGASGVASGAGVVGECDNGATAVGVWGRSSSGDGVYGSGSSSGVYGSGATSGVTGISEAGFGVFGSGSTGVYGLASGSGYGGIFHSANGTGLQASGNPAIVAVGNVGIGTSSPVAPLHVQQGSGSSATPASAAIVVDAQTNTAGIWGASGAINGAGLIGECDNGASATGVSGISTSGYGVAGYGGSYGGYFVSYSTGLYAQGSPAIRTSGSVGINTVPAATLHVIGTTATVGDNTADFYNPSIGPNHSHIHYGTLGDWYIRSASNFGVVAMQDQSAGAFVGIGTSTPGYKLDVNGTIRANNVSPSDARWKKNIVPLTNGLVTIEQLRGVRYDWRAEEFPKTNFEPGPQIGLIAQEVRKILPEAVSQDRDGFYSIAYTKLIPVLVEGMKEQQGQLRAKDAKIVELEKEISEMKTAQRLAGADWEARFVILQKSIARLADKFESNFAFNSETAEEK